MTASITDHLTADHRRLEALLDAATRTDPIDLVPYAEFRRGLLRHIGIEEKMLIPAAQRAGAAIPANVVDRLRLDHGAIAALLVPTPTPTIVATLREILGRHDEVEEGTTGVYAVCDRALAGEASALVAEMEAHPAVKVNPHNDAAVVMPAVERALSRAGYSLARS